MLELVRRTIAEWQMVRSGDVLGVAVSGGADSVALLHALHELAPELGIRLHVIHLNHGLRGPESDADARFAEDCAGRLGWPVTIDRADLLTAAGNLEQAGREARLRLFRRLREAGTVRRTATGHTRSDQAETVLYRLLRGSGTAGLSGIRPTGGDGVVRPLIGCSRAEVLRFLEERKLTWREDATNQSSDFTRNWLRHQVLPVLCERLGPAVPDILAATAALAADEESWWAAEIRDLARTCLKKNRDAVLLRADELRRMHPAVARRFLRHAIAEAKGDMRSIDLLHVERVRELAGQADGHGRIQIPGLDVFRSFEYLRLAAPRTQTRSARNYSMALLPRKGEEIHRPLPEAGCSIFLEISDLSPGEPSGAYNKDVDELDWERLPGALVIRNWYPGDELDPPGRSRQKIKLFFQEQRIPIWDRQTWPVLESGNEVVWSRQFGPSGRYLPDERTRYVLRVHAVADSPAEAGMSPLESRESNEPI